MLKVLSCLTTEHDLRFVLVGPHSESQPCQQQPAQKTGCHPPARLRQWRQEMPQFHGEKGDVLLGRLYQSLVSSSFQACLHIEQARVHSLGASILGAVSLREQHRGLIIQPEPVETPSGLEHKGGIRALRNGSSFHPGTQHQRHFECEESPYESVSIREGSGLGYDATQSLLLCQV